MTSSSSKAHKPVKEDQASSESGWWSVRGRINRGTFMGRAVTCWGGAWLILLPLKSAGQGFGLLLILTALVLGLLGCLQAIKRAHDFGLGGWSVVLTLTLYVNVLWFFVLALVPGRQTANKHGDVPVDAPVADLSPAVDREQDMARLVSMMGDGKR